MNSIYYVGMDIHKDNYTLCCYSFERDELEYRQTVAPDFKMVLKYLELLSLKLLPYALRHWMIYN